MPENNGENIVERNPDGTLKKGSVLNPKGKPKGKRHMTTLLKEAIEKEVQGMGETYDKIITKRVIKSAIEGEQWAVKLVYEYLDGKPIQQLNVDAEVTEVSHEQRQQIEKALQDII